jgi:hypothetical protein
MNVSFHINPAAEEPPARKINASLRHRPRSESLDDRRSSQDLECPTQESESRHPLIADGEEPEEQPIVHRRRRSASYSVPSSPGIGAGPFDPILEEPVGDDLQRVLGGDSAR